MSLRAEAWRALGLCTMVTAGLVGCTSELVVLDSDERESGGNVNNGGGRAGVEEATAHGPLPCDVLRDAGFPCVAAHSTVRKLVSSYDGPLYQLCTGYLRDFWSAGPSSCQSRGIALDIGTTEDGYADAKSQDDFCMGRECVISIVYDQSGQGNHLEPAPGGDAKATPRTPVRADVLPIEAGGHWVYGMRLRPGSGYRTGCNRCNIMTGNGTAVGDEPQTIYMVTSSEGLNDGCCFDYGNAETTSNDDGNGAMEAVYFGGGVVWGTGFGGEGPWVMADLENGLFPGWENGSYDNISTNMPLRHDFVTAVLVGDTHERNGGKGRFALYGGDATSGTLREMYDGMRPVPGYVPMKKQGSIILGTGGDNSSSGAGHFYEGVMTNGAADRATVDALQASIVRAGYGR